MICSTSSTKIELYQGDSLDVEFTIQYESGNPVDLTNYNVRFRVFNTNLLKVSTNAAQVTINNITGGIATVHIKPSDTTGLTQSYNYTYDAEIYDASGNVYTFLQGTFRIK